MKTYQAGEAFPTPCPECEGRRVVTVCTEAGVGRPSSNKEWIANSKYLCDVGAVVCIQCGHMTLFAWNVERLRQDVEKHPQNYRDASRVLRQSLNQH